MGLSMLNQWRQGKTLEMIGKGLPSAQIEAIVYHRRTWVNADLNTCCDTLRGRKRTTYFNALRAICCDPSGVMMPRSHRDDPGGVTAC
jgi:hypothetical protein